MKKILFSFILANLLVAPILIFAQAQDTIVPKADPTIAGEIGKLTMNSNPIDKTLNTVANYVVGALVVLAVFYVLWAAYTFVTSAGSAEKVEEARKRILYAGIGIVVALLAKGIVSLVLSAATKQ